MSGSVLLPIILVWACRLAEEVAPILQEFRFSQQALMGKALEWHRAIRQSFCDVSLPRSFSISMDNLRRLRGVSDASTCFAWLSLLTEIFLWLAPSSRDTALYLDASSDGDTSFLSQAQPSKPHSLNPTFWMSSLLITDAVARTQAHRVTFFSFRSCWPSLPPCVEYFRGAAQKQAFARSFIGNVVQCGKFLAAIGADHDDEIGVELLSFSILLRLFLNFGLCVLSRRRRLNCRHKDGRNRWKFNNVYIGKATAVARQFSLWRTS